MQATMTADLPKSLVSSESYKIWRENTSGMQESLTANFIYALKNFWRDYLPKARPSFPQGFEIDHDQYLGIEELGKRSEAWKAIQAKYSGYFKNLHETEAENLSNLHFLKQAHEHFSRIGMIDYAGRVQGMIAKFS